MTTKMTQVRTGEISFIVWTRAISMVLILLCHLAQTHINAYIVMTSQIFNVGVNVFIVISGFLFGRLGVKQPYSRWLVKRMKRIYLPYWLFFAILTVVHILQGTGIHFLRWIQGALGIHGFDYLFPGFEHTWFVTAILLCYLLTPLIDSVTAKLIHTDKTVFIPICVLFLLAVGIAFLPEYAILGTVPFYAMAFLLGKRWDRYKICPKHGVLALVGVAVSFAVRFAGRAFFDDSFFYTRMIAQYTHYIAAFCLFIAGAAFLNHTPPKLVKIMSAVSFEVYLYHYMFMWPPLSVMGMSGNWIIDCLIVVILTFVIAWCMNGLIDWFDRKLAKS